MTEPLVRIQSDAPAVQEELELIWKQGRGHPAPPHRYRPHGHPPGKLSHRSRATLDRVGTSRVRFNRFYGGKVRLSQFHDDLNEPFVGGMA